MAKPLDEKKNLLDIAKQFEEKLLKIKVCLFDVDGILSNGHITWEGEDVGFNRTTHALDGHGFKMMMRAGLKMGVISGGDSIAIRKRLIDNLGLDFVYLGNEDKREAYKKILAQGYTDEQILFMGDDFIDLPILKRVGFSVTVPGASLEIQEAVDYITYREAGNACAREVMDIVRYAQKLPIQVLEF